MLDILGIIFSSTIMFLVIFRAIQLDQVQPWFRPAKTGADRSGLRLRPNDGATGGDGETAPRTARESPARRRSWQRQ